MIEQIIIQYLTNNNIITYAEKPDNPVGNYALVARVSGSITNQIRRSNIDIQVYSDSMYNAALLNEQVIELMRDFECAEIGGIHLINEQTYSDLENGIYSYQSTWEIFYY